MSQRTTRSKEEVAGIIKSILVAEKKSSTIGVPIVQLEDEYRSQDGMRIPYRALGYACLMDFLESLQRSGEIVIGKRGSMHVVYLCVDEKIAHVSALVSGQKDSSKRCSRGGKRFTTRSYPRVLYQPPRLDSKTLADVLKLIKTAANGIHASRIIEYLHDRNNFNVDEDQLMRQLRDVSHEVSIVNSTIFPIMRKKVSPRNSPQKNYNSTNGFAGEKRSSPAYRPAGSSDGEEDNETFEFVTKSDNTQLPMSNNANLIYEETQAAPSNFEENADAARRENTNPRVDDDDDDIGLLVNKRTRFRLEKLIQKHPNGIWCAELPEFYRQEYSIPLNYEDLGFGNVSDFAAHLPEIFHCVRLQENGDFKLFDAKSPKPETRQNPRPEHLSLAALHSIYERFNEDVDPVPVLLSPTTSRRLVPEGVMTIGETVAQICVTELFNDNTPHIDVIVVDTVTPTFFWIQLLRKLQKFDRFMRDLHVFYSENASKYVMPIVLLERGLNCACIFDKKWHRGVIKTVKPNSTVTVLFYDYGTVMTYPPEDIHFLHRSFSNLPAQAIPCGLYNVKPIDTEKWPYSVCQLFAEKVLDVPMVAMMGSIDADNNSMLIALTNTSGAVDFHISDWMISSGFAIYGKMGETVDMNESYQEKSPQHPTIRLAEESLDAPDSANQNLSSARSPQVEMEIAKIRDEMQTQFNAIMQTQFNAIMQTQFNAIMQQLHSMIEACASKSRQLEAEQSLDQCADSKMFDDLLNNMRIDPQNDQQGVSSEPPPLPPRPMKNYTNFTTGSEEFHEKPKVQSFNATEHLQENVYVPPNFQKCDVNINCANNPFDYVATNALMNPLYNSDYQLPLKNDNQLHSAMWNDFINSEALQASAASFQDSRQAAANFFSNQKENPPIIPQENQPKDLINLMSFEKENAKSYFERLDAKFRLQNQETNPFKVAMESDKVEDKNSFPGASSMSSRSSVINPFAPEANASQRDTISNTRSIYPELPVNWDFSRRNGAQSELDAAAGAKNVESEREDLEAGDESPEKNVERREEKRQNVTARPVMPKIKEKKVKVKEMDNLPKIQETEVWMADKSWNFKEIHLTKQTVHLINLNNEGWITLEEFTKAFTTWTMPEIILKILDIQNARIPFRFIQRVNYPTLFNKLERTSLAVTRNHNNKIGDVLQLAPLKSILKILRKLQIVNLEEVELATKKRIFPSKNPALFDASTIITIYANLQHDTTS